MSREWDNVVGISHAIGHCITYADTRIMDS